MCVSELCMHIDILWYQILIYFWDLQLFVFFRWTFLSWFIFFLNWKVKFIETFEIVRGFSFLLISLKIFVQFGICSESSPGGNQVDGLPPAQHRVPETSNYENSKIWSFQMKSGSVRIPKHVWSLISTKPHLLKLTFDVPKFGNRDFGWQLFPIFSENCHQPKTNRFQNPAVCFWINPMCVSSFVCILIASDIIFWFIFETSTFCHFWVNIFVWFIFFLNYSNLSKHLKRSRVSSLFKNIISARRVPRAETWLTVYRPLSIRRQHTASFPTNKLRQI